MKIYFIPILLIFTCRFGISQDAINSEEFEGIVKYKIEVRSKVDFISNKAISNLFLTGGSLTTYIKKGNYLQSTSKHDLYYINEKQRAFFKFKTSDTLYYLDYNADVAPVINVSKEKASRLIAGYNCDIIIVKTKDEIKKYYYSPLLAQNPDYDRDNKLGNFNVYMKEAGAVWLAEEVETDLYFIATTATKVEPRTVEQTIFDLPSLPQKKFIYEEHIRPAEFKRTGGFQKYISTTVDASLGARYIKIAKGEKEAGQTVMVSFLITETGSVTDVRVENKKDVHPKLAEEAVRVISTSPLWSPATLFGEKIIYRLKIPITFVAAKE
jgi:TonB family protein